MNPESFTVVGFCEGCGLRKALANVRCLGCMYLFGRCRECAPQFTSCSQACQVKHREKLNSYFGENAPPISGDGPP